MERKWNRHRAEVAPVGYSLECTDGPIIARYSELSREQTRVLPEDFTDHLVEAAVPSVSNYSVATEHNGRSQRLRFEAQCSVS